MADKQTTNEGSQPADPRPPKADSPVDPRPADTTSDPRKRDYEPMGQDAEREGHGLTTRDL